MRDEWTEWNKGRMKERDERKNDTNSNRGVEKQRKDGSKKEKL